MSTIDLIQSGSIIFTLIVTVIQMIYYSRNQKTSIVTRISERNDALLQDIVANAKVFESFAESFDPHKQNIYNDPRVPIMYRTLNFFDELFYYRQKGSINKGTFNLYQKTLQMFLEKEFAKSFWKHVRDEYSPEFQKVVDQATGP